VSKASVPLLGAVLMVGVTVLLAGVVTVVATGMISTDSGTSITIDVSADGSTGQVTIEHVSGRSLDVRQLTIEVAVDGESLAHQPPVPFYAAEGFAGFPNGPFNPAADPAWTAGETAGFEVAATTNHPSLTAGAELTVTIIRDDQIVARGTTTVT